MVQSPVVHAPAGTLSGFTADGFDQFRGVPFAEPPTGDNRWRPPQQLKPWSGVLNATAFGAPCLQSSFGWPTIENLANQDESCLFLNVVTPKGAAAVAEATATAKAKGSAAAKATATSPAGSSSSSSSSSSFPVVVYFHAGGFNSGAPSDKETDLPFADDVVLVTPASRLGAWGFLAGEALRPRGGGGNGTGSYGLADQREALRWVRANIAAFGGDPARVTIMGESSGGSCVAAHLTTPASFGLFHRAVLESPGLTQVQTLEHAETNYGFLLDGLLGAGSAGCAREAGVYTSYENALVSHDEIRGQGGDEAGGWNASRACAACDALGADCQAVSVLEDPASASGKAFSLHNSSSLSAGYRIARYLPPGGSAAALLKAARGGEAGVACLLGADAKYLTELAAGAPCTDTMATDMWAPAVDGVDLPLSFVDAAAQGSLAPGVDILAGSNMDEGTLFMGLLPTLRCNASDADFGAWATDYFGAAMGAKVPPVFASLRDPVPPCVDHHYGPTPAPAPGPPAPGAAHARQAAMRASGDFVISCPLRDLSLALAARAGSDVFNYYFTHTPLWSANYGNTSTLGAFHGAEVAFAFGDKWELNTTEERALGAAMGCYWRNFAHTANPNTPPPGLPPCAGGQPPKWPKFASAAQDWTAVLDVKAGGGVTAVQSLLKEQCDVLTGGHWEPPAQQRAVRARKFSLPL